MSGNFEKIATDIVRIYMDCKMEQNKMYLERHMGMFHDFQYDTFVNDPHTIASTVEDIANRLSRNAMDRIVRYDNEAYDREVVKLLEGENNG